MKTLALLLALTAATSVVSAKIVTKPVAYEHAGVKLEGFLVYDDTKATATTKQPACW